MGKSAQIFLHTWLPDAMGGPTPVSAFFRQAAGASVYLVLLTFLYSLRFAFEPSARQRNITVQDAGASIGPVKVPWPARLSSY